MGTTSSFLICGSLEVPESELHEKLTIETGESQFTISNSIDRLQSGDEYLPPVPSNTPENDSLTSNPVVSVTSNLLHQVIFEKLLILKNDQSMDDSQSSANSTIMQELMAGNIISNIEIEGSSMDGSTDNDSREEYSSDGGGILRLHRSDEEEYDLPGVYDLNSLSLGPIIFGDTPPSSVDTGADTVKNNPFPRIHQLVALTDKEIEEKKAGNSIEYIPNKDMSTSEGSWNTLTSSLTDKTEQSSEQATNTDSYPKIKKKKTLSRGIRKTVSAIFKPFGFKSNKQKLIEKEEEDNLTKISRMPTSILMN